MAPAGQEAGDSGAIGTGAFNPERANLSQAPGPPFELTVPERGCWHVTLSETNTLAVNGHRHMVVLVSVDSETNTLAVNGHRHMVVLVSVDSDNNLDSTTTFTTHNSCHSYLPEDGAPTR